MNSQVSMEWSKRFNSGTGNSIAIDNTGSIYIGGTEGSGSNTNFIIIKYDPSGMQKWTAIYNGPGNSYDGIDEIAIDGSCNIYATGSSTGINTGSDFTTVKFSNSGYLQWVRRYSSNGNGRDASYSLSIDNIGNVYVTGESKNNIGGIDCLTLKYDSVGNQLWINNFNRGLNSSNQGFDVTVDDSFNVYLTGRSDGDFMTIKYNKLGFQQWAVFYNGPMNGNDAARSIEVDNLGNVYVSGSSTGDMFYYDYATVKYNSDGEEQWVRRYNGSSNFQDQLRAMIVDSIGNVYVTGNSTESGTGYDYTTIKYNTNGDILWITRYHNGLNDIAFAMDVDDTGNVYVTGESDGNGTSDDYATVKYDSSGQQKWVKRYDYSAQFSDFATALAVDNNGSVYVTGSSNRDILTIKYSLLTGVNPISFVTPSEYNLSQNYPNPFNPKTFISYELRVSSFTKLIVSDVLGNEVTTLENENKPAGNYQIEFDGANYPSGVYLYRLEIDGNIIDTKRMVLLK
ncbi:MAG TPA: SBBP repeat-containing protein [Ignavibacteria bacterium]|mgnify:CR=1 FL=1|nr:SBBP repeat-containing protein [Ignavibacteria bacterium]HQY53526.1 SBBP repeat-containing protein [Ignavibacteria bacterium]HRB00716.1 SBBP repeat-containing protein [Ignavibacteria bacterium]